MAEDDILKIRESELEEIIEEKVEKRLSKRENKEKPKQRNLSRREFLKKAGIGAFGLAALSSPVSAALNIRDTGLNAYTQNTGEKLTFDVDNNGNVSIPEGNLTIKENTAIHAGNLSNYDADNLSGNNGTNGQVLQTDGNNTSWSTIDTSAPVDSVNGQTGTVTLNYNDVGAKSDSYSAPVDDVNGQTGSVNIDVDPSLNANLSDVTSTKQLNTTYTNNSGGPIFISITGKAGRGGGGGSLQINGNTVVSDGSDVSEGDVPVVSGIVPNGATYSVSMTEGLTYWIEVQLSII